MFKGLVSSLLPSSKAESKTEGANEKENNVTIDADNLVGTIVSSNTDDDEAATFSSSTSNDETATLSTLKNMFEPDSEEVTKQNDKELAAKMREEGKSEGFIEDVFNTLDELDKVDSKRHSQVMEGQEHLKQGQEQILDGVGELEAKLEEGVVDIKEGQGEIRGGVDDLKLGQTKLQDVLLISKRPSTSPKVVMSMTRSACSALRLESTKTSCF